jgi:hypothetical protein
MTRLRPAGQSGDVAYRDIPADNQFFLTSFGGGSDTQPVACGGPIADGSWWYSTSSYRWPCGTKLVVTNPANNRSVVVQVADVGPAKWVEDRAGGPVLDASPLVAQYLFGHSSEGYADHARVIVNIAPDQGVFLGPTDLIARIGTNWMPWLVTALAAAAAWTGYKAWQHGELAALGLPPPRRVYRNPSRRRSRR